MQYSVIIPVHNEAEHVERQVTGFVESLPGDAARVLQEIILVENGSRDQTLDACRRLEQKFPALVRTCVLSRGSYGEAVKFGMLQCKGTHLSILECDFLDSSFLLRSITLFRTGNAQLIIGSKRHPDAVDGRPFKRRALTAIYNLIILRMFLGYPGSDTHGLKSVEAVCAKRLCEIAQSTDEIFQTEFVLIAWRLGVTIQEIPVSIREIRSASISISRRAPKVLGTIRVLKASLRRFPAVPDPAFPIEARPMSAPAVHQSQS